MVSMIVEDGVRHTRVILHDHESGSASARLRGVAGISGVSLVTHVPLGDGQEAKQRVDTRRP